MVCGFYLFDYVTATMERATETSTETATAKASDILPFGFFFAASSYYVSLNTVSSFVYITPIFYERTEPCFVHPRPPVHCPK